MEGCRNGGIHSEGYVERRAFQVGEEIEAWSQESATS